MMDVNVHRKRMWLLILWLSDFESETVNVITDGSVSTTPGHAQPRVT